MTFRTIGLEIDNSVYQRAVTKAVSEGKTIHQVLVELLEESYAAQTVYDPAAHRRGRRGSGRPA